MGRGAPPGWESVLQSKAAQEGIAKQSRGQASPIKIAAEDHGQDLTRRRTQVAGPTRTSQHAARPTALAFVGRVRPSRQRHATDCYYIISRLGWLCGADARVSDQRSRVPCEAKNNNGVAVGLS